MRIVDTVYYWARVTPFRPAIIETSGVITYSRLAQAIEAAASDFERHITDTSRPVALSVRTGSKMLVSLLGLLRAGFDVVLANPAIFKELDAIGVKTLVFERGGQTLEGAESIVFNDAWLTSGPEKTSTKMPSKPAANTAGNILCFTSGTTGRPKPIVCPQSSWEQRIIFPLNSAFANYDRMLIVPGLTTSWGLSRAYEALHAGRTICHSLPGMPALWLANTYGAETMLVSPQQAIELVELQEKASPLPLRSLKTVQIGAAAINHDAARRIRKNLCRDIVLIYGSTEAGVVAVAPYDTVAAVPGAVGYIQPGIDVQTVDAAGRVLPIGKEGFVRVRSRVFAINMAASKIEDEWFYTGDLGWVTDDGMLCVAGRSGDVINRGGEKLAMPDIENFLRSCAGIKDVGACTVTGPSGFSEVWVGLVFEPMADVTAARFALEANPLYRNNIDKIFAVDTVPRGTLGKIQRDELKNMLQAIVDGTDGRS